MLPSHVRGADTPGLREDTIGAVLDEAARKWPSRDALVSLHQGIRWSYAEFARRADAAAGALLQLGLERGDRIGIWSPNCAEWAVTQFAAAKAGLILVNINPAYRSTEAAYTFAKTGMRALVTAAQFKSSDYLAMLEEIAPTLPALRTTIQIDGPLRPGHLSFEALYEPGGLALPRDLANNDAANIQFTSGTTGLPKGATLSHRNIVNNALFVGRGMGLREGDRLCIPVPLYHCFGMVMGNLACVLHGATMIYPAAGFDPGAVLASVEAERCTHLHGVPTMFIAELDHPDFDKFDLGSLRGGIMAGAPCPVEVMRQVTERMHMREVTIAYGMTETSPVSFQSEVSDPIERRVASVGRVQPHLEVKLVDESGRIVPRGVPGELCTRGYSVMLGYWDEPAKTSEVLDADAWMHTGDIGVLDDEGYCNIVGRVKDMIIRGGENISPREIEEFLFTHPKILEVQVIGLPDPKYGEAVCACIRLRAGEACTAEEIIAYCGDRIAHYKVPRHVQFMEAFPLTATGKVRKVELRETLIRELSLVTPITA
ncbi:MAG: lcfB 3 [Rhodospirillales bacterium]|nr:lcfB 3 [Rhodospirillales bacterium]